MKITHWFISFNTYLYLYLSYLYIYSDAIFISPSTSMRHFLRRCCITLGNIFNINSVELNFSAVLKLNRYVDFKTVFSFLLSRQVLSLQLILIWPYFLGKWRRPTTGSYLFRLDIILFSYSCNYSILL